MAARFLSVLIAALVLAPASFAASSPQNLHAFQFKADEPAKPTHTFARTPAFAWDPVAGADHYEFELSTSATFAENGIVWENAAVEGPLMTVPLTLPWMSGAKYSFYAHVRAVVDGEPGPWSAPYGFNMRAPGAPRSLSNGSNPNPGMVRWTPVDGATAYEVVWLYELGQGKAKKIKTQTTAADLREYYTLHNGVDWANIVYWRVRAVRELDTQSAKNGLTTVTYGPWSARNRTLEPAIGTGSIDLQGAISRSRPGADLRSPNTTSSEAGPHELMPALWWTGVKSPAPESLGLCPSVAALYGITCPLFRVYVYTDADCVNRVHSGDIVGSPAYVPRLSGTLELPADSKKLAKAALVWLGDGDEGNAYDAGGDAMLATGVVSEGSSSSSDTSDSSTSDSSSGDSSSGDSSSSASADEAAAEGVTLDRKNSLWDLNWQTSRYYWTTVPVVPLLIIESDSGEAKVEWHDAAFGQDMCAAGEVGVFGKTSAVATEAESGVPYASGMSSSGKLAAATTSNPTFFGSPVLAWKPAPGAQSYELQWSKTAYPWRTAGKLTTPATTALVDLPVGHWYYRVRGLDRTLPGLPGLTWSSAAEVTIVPPTFTVVSSTSNAKKGRS
jgi:hypothetical protein